LGVQAIHLSSCLMLTSWVVVGGLTLMDSGVTVKREPRGEPGNFEWSLTTLDYRPTTNGAITNGNMTTFRMGIIGNRFVSDFFF
jgi:hypothetical protein